MVHIAVYAAARRDLLNSWSRRGAGDANNACSRVVVDDVKTKKNKDRPMGCLGFVRRCSPPLRAHTNEEKQNLKTKPKSKRKNEQTLVFWGRGRGGRPNAANV